jgi:hypothetical protein
MWPHTKHTFGTLSDFLGGVFRPHMWTKTLCFFLFGFLAPVEQKKTLSNCAELPKLLSQNFLFGFFRVRPIAAHSAYCLSYRYGQLYGYGQLLNFWEAFPKYDCGQKHDKKKSIAEAEDMPSVQTLALETRLGNNKSTPFSANVQMAPGTEFCSSSLVSRSS